jgi:hypothetical protein
VVAVTAREEGKPPRVEVERQHPEAVGVRKQVQGSW